MEASSLQYDDLDRHVAASGDLAKAVVPMGMLVSWCVNMGLLDADIGRRHDQLVLRIRMQDALGSELLIACGGDLRREMFSAQGQQFLDEFYPRFEQVYRSVFGAAFYETPEDWDNYQRLARVLTQAYLGPKPKHAVPGSGLMGKLKRLFGRG